MIPEADFDSPWKEAIERYLRECLALLLPQAHNEIDWSRGFDFRDTELQRVAHAGRPVVSVAILGDERPSWRPRPYRTSRWGCAVSFEFPVIKLLDFRARWDELEASANPFAGVIMAHLRAIETRQDPSRRSVAKLALVRWLLTREYSREDARTLFRFIDWLMVLPREVTERFWREVHAYEEEVHMPYITSIDRSARVP